MSIEDKTFTPKLKFIIGLMAIGVIMRILPHYPNFVPIGAMALFGGTYLTNKKWAFAIPLLAMLVSDILLELFLGIGFHGNMIAVYISYILIVCLGFLLRGREQRQTIMVASLFGSMLFFIITNFSVWLSGAYGYGIEGLTACYVAAIPFFKGTVLGDLFYNLLFFGGYALAKWRFPVLARD